MPQTLKKLKLLVLILTSSSINQKFQRTFLDKSSLKVATTLTKTSVTDVILPLICLVLTSPNLSLSVTCVQRLSLMLLPTSQLNKVTNQSASITWATGVNNLVCLLLPIRNGVARKLSKPILSMNSFNFMCVSMPKLKKTHLQTKKLVNGSVNWKLVMRKQLPSGNGSVTKAQWNSTVSTMNLVFHLIATMVKLSTMIRWMKSQTF